MLDFRATNNSSEDTKYQCISTLKLSKYVESSISSGYEDMLSTRIIPSFLSAARRYNLKEVSDDSLRIWVVDMFLNGVKSSTIRRYLGGLHTLYSKECHFESLNPFPRILKDLEKVTSPVVKVSIENSNVLPRLLKKNIESDECTTINLFFYLLYNVRSSIKDAIYLKYEETPMYCSQIDDIIESMHRAPQSKYVFALGQGKKREKQIISESLSEMYAFLKKMGMEFIDNFSRKDITSIWITSALKYGIDICSIRSLVDVLPDEYSFFSLLPKNMIDVEQEHTIIRNVAEYINGNSSKWFVMKLRHGKTPDEIRKKIEMFDGDHFKSIAYYYPTHKVIVKNKKKKEFEDIPYIPGILFFKLRKDKVGALFNLIGDLAWCFRTTNSPDSPYSSISIKEMKNFQRHIGQFTPDIKVDLCTNLNKASLGDKVKVIGGTFEGQSGIIKKIKDVNGETSYILELSESTYIKWKEITIESVFVD